MRSHVLLWAIAFFFCLVIPPSISNAVELARVGDWVITSEEYLEDLRSVMPTNRAPAKTLEGRKEFLERIIAKHLLSHYTHSRGWDTLTAWNRQLLLEYKKGLYLQSLYRDAIPEANRPGSVDTITLAGLGMKFVDSLTAAYVVHAEERAAALMASNSVGLLKTAPTDDEGHAIFEWSKAFTDEEKALPAATFTGGVLMTIGDFVGELDQMPPFARPTAGNSDQIAEAVVHVAKDRVYSLEFDKRNLSQQPWFRERMASKREEMAATAMFRAMIDTSTVSEEEAKAYFDEHEDDFLTPTLVKVTMISVDSEDVANQIAKRIAEGKSFESVAVDYSVYTSSRAGFDTTGLVDRSFFPPIYDAIWDRGIGEVVGPIYLSDRDLWVVAKLVGRQNPRPPAFEEALPAIDKKLGFLKADGALARLIAQLRSQVGVVVDYQALEKLELPQWAQ
jgi:peptidyl-prolyl cis-trans isomerase C